MRETEQASDAGVLEVRRAAPAPGTFDKPSTGLVLLGVENAQPVLISAAEYWVEDSEHVIASTELQVSVSDDSFKGAFEQFVDSVFEHAQLLHELIEAGDAADNEREEWELLSERLAEWAAAEHEARRKSVMAQRVAAFRRLLRGGVSQENLWQTQPAQRAPSVARSHA